MKTKIILAIIMVVASFTDALSQQNLNSATPEAGQLASNVNAQLIDNSGGFNINIPLYELKSGDITIPLSMSYDATGVKVAAHPGIIGQNWSLQAGGMITRIVKGKPDEKYDIIASDSKLEYKEVGYFYAREKFLQDNYFFDEDNFSGLSIDIDKKILNNNELDFEPDEFIFNFNGQSGKFIMNADGEFVVIGMTGYKIEVSTKIIKNFTVPGYTYKTTSQYTYNYRVENNKITGFKITDPSGYEYYFGRFENNDDNSLDGIDVSSDFFAQIYEDIYSTWHLVKIISPSNKTAIFNYETMDYIAEFSVLVSRNSLDKFADVSNSTFDPLDLQAKYDSTFIGSLIQPQYLKSIVLDDTTISLVYSESNAKTYNYDHIKDYLTFLSENIYDYHLRSSSRFGLWPIANTNDEGIHKEIDRIDIKSSINNTQSLSYVFDYREEPDKRLQLKSLTTCGTTETMPPYHFEYNENQLPDYFSPLTDHWGYFNNNSYLEDVNNKSNSLTYSNYYIYKKPTTYTLYESLVRVKYPTGGIKEYQFELNKYSKYIEINYDGYAVGVISKDGYGGGLRIKKETTMTEAGQEISSNHYEYSGGILNSLPKYYWENHNVQAYDYIMHNYHCSNPTCQNNIKDGEFKICGFCTPYEVDPTYIHNQLLSCEYFSSQSVKPISDNSGGSPVTYSQITELSIGNGKVVKHYTNYDDNLLDDKCRRIVGRYYGNYEPVSSRIAERGRLLKVEVFKENETGGYIIVNKVENVYSSLNTDQYVDAIMTMITPTESTNYNNIVNLVHYKIYTEPVLLTQSTETQYFTDINSQLSTVKNYTYDDDYNIKTTASKVNNGTKTILQEFDYAHSSPEDIYDNTNLDPDDFISKNLLQLPKKVKTSINGVLVNTVKYDYSSNNFQIYQSQVTQENSDGSIDIQADGVMVNSKGNIIQVRKDNVYTVYIWGYNGKYLLAEITNADYYMVKNNLGSNIFESALTKNNSYVATLDALRNSSEFRQSQITTYTYNGLWGIESITDPNGKKTYYEYDNIGRLITIKDQDNKIIESYTYNYKMNQ